MENQEELEQELTVKEKTGEFVKFAGMSWSYWFATCFVSYLTIFLQSLGWSTSQVGLMNSINSAIGVFTGPFWGVLSDKIRSIRKIVIFLIFAGAITYAIIPFVDFRIAGVSVLFIIVPLSNFFRGPLGSLIDNWTVRTCSRHGLNFGTIRSFGSFSYGVIGLILGYVVTRVDAGSESGNLGTVLTFVFYAVLLLGLLIFVIPARDDQGGVGKKSVKFKDMDFGRLFKNYHYVTYMCYSVIIQVPLSCVHSFIPYLLADINVSSSTYGYITGYKAFIEIPMLLLLKKARSKMPLYYLLFGAGFGYMLEAMLYSQAQNFWHILLISTLQGLGGGLQIAAASNYVYTLAPDDLKASAQTFNGAMASVAGIFGNLAGGVLIDLVGIRTFYLGTGILIFVALSLYICSFPFGEKVLHIKKPGIS